MSDIEDESGVEMTEELLATWSKKELVKWLIDHKQKKTGNKPVLVHRILRSLRFDNSSQSDSDSSEYSSGEESEPIPPLSSLQDGWASISTSVCPPIRQEDVDNYFIFNKNPFTGKHKNCHRQLKKAKKFSNENYIHDIKIHDINSESDYCYVTSKCKPSMRDTVIVNTGNGKGTHHYSLHVTMVKKTGKVESGLCNCKPGDSGVCSHIGGLLLTLVKIKTACTTKGCEWLQPQTKKKLSPKRLQDIKIVNPVKEKEQPIKPYPNVYQAGPFKDPDSFLKEVMSGLGQANPSCVLYQTLNPNIIDLSEIMEKYQPNFMYNDSVNLNSTVCQTEFRGFVNDLIMTEEDILAVSDSTKGQSSNQNWKEMRKNVLTASNFGMICKKKFETPPENVISNIRGYSTFTTKPMRYGLKKENQARKDYMKDHLKKCGTVSVKTPGLYISQEYPFLGASVDGIVNCEKCGKGGLEIKCPYSGRNMKPEDCTTLKNFFMVKNENNELVLKENHNYMYQIMGQMKVLGLDWCDFTVWAKRGLRIQRVTFSEKFWTENMLFKLKFFYCSFFVAEIFSNRVKRGLNLV